MTVGDAPAGRVRLDKWCWAARFYKTRGLASEAIAAGRVRVNEALAKPAREVHVGDRVELRLPGAMTVEVVVLGLSSVRGPAPAAQALYDETEASRTRREQAAAARRLAPEPAATLDQGRPTKRDRRAIDQASRDWQRWSVSLDDDD